MESQQQAWAKLIKISEELVKISYDIKDFAVEEAIDTITEACDNYLNEEEVE